MKFAGQLRYDLLLLILAGCFPHTSDQNSLFWWGRPQVKERCSPHHLDGPLSLWHTHAGADLGCQATVGQLLPKLRSCSVALLSLHCLLMGRKSLLSYALPENKTALEMTSNFSTWRILCLHAPRFHIRTELWILIFYLAIKINKQTKSEVAFICCSSCFCLGNSSNSDGDFLSFICQQCGFLLTFLLFFFGVVVVVVVSFFPDIRRWLMLTVHSLTENLSGLALEFF